VKGLLLVLSSTVLSHIFYLHNCWHVFLTRVSEELKAVQGDLQIFSPGEDALEILRMAIPAMPVSSQTAL